MTDRNDPSPERRFSDAALAGNAVAAAAAAGAAMFAASGAVIPALVAAGAGAAVGYTLTNEIPKGD
jgi:hypothetical protein